MANKAGHIIFLSTTAVFGFPTRVTLLQTRKKAHTFSKGVRLNYSFPALETA